MLARSAFRSTHGTSKQERGQLHVSPFRETRCLWRRNTARVRSRIILSVLATAQILSNYELGAAAAGHPCGALAPWPPLSFAPSTASQASVSQRITSTRSYSRGPRPPPTCGTIFSSTSSGNQAGTRITQTMCYDLKAAQNSIVLPPPTEQRVKTIDDKPVCSQCLKPSFFSKQDQSWHQASDCRGDSPLGSSNSRTSVDVDASGVPYTTRISTSPHIQSPSLTHANTSTFYKRHHRRWRHRPSRNDALPKVWNQRQLRKPSHRGNIVERARPSPLCRYEDQGPRRPRALAQGTFSCPA
jgi:hypothetical protein